MKSNLNVAGWEHYPKRLRNYDPLREDGGSYDNRLTTDDNRLFTEKGKLSIDVMDISSDEFSSDDKGPTKFEDLEAFETCLGANPAKRESRFYYIKPSHPKVISRSRLHIPQETMRKILTTHQVMPGFIDFLQAFGRKSSSSDTGFGGCKRKIEYAPTSPGFNQADRKRGIDYYEICYNLKYAEKNNRLSNDPWSVRQTCVYQKFEYDCKRSTWILVQPSEKARSRLQEVFRSRTTEDIDRSVHNPLDIHLLFVSASAENWRWYFNDLEESLSDMTQNALHSSVGRKPFDSKMAPVFGNPDITLDFEIEFKDVQNLQRFEEKVQNLLLALQSNRDAILCLQKHNSQLQKCNLGLEDYHFSSVDDSLDTYLVELSIYTRNVQSLLTRIHGRSKLLYNILDFRNAETAHRHGQKTTDFAELGRRDTDIMMKMTKRTTREAVAVKIVTFVTLLYLPATFVATFLSANCIKFIDLNVEGRETQKLTVSKDMILFGAITGPLMCITLGFWYFWDKREGNRVAEEMGEKNHVE